jgi:hypothetical protein
LTADPSRDPMAFSQPIGPSIRKGGTMKATVKHFRYVLGSLSAVMFASAAARTL